MSEQTAISWCDSTFNPWIGCTKISPACDHCYAARQDAFRKWTPEGWGGPRRRTSASLWKQPERWNAMDFVQCAACGHRCALRDFRAVDGPADWTMCPVCSGADWHGARRRVFCASLGDVFDNQAAPEWREDLFALIERTPHLDWLLLTKRIGNAAQMMFLARGGHLPLLPNVCLGATICNQEEADRDIPKLLATPARVRFLSIEPMLGPVDLRPYLRPKFRESADPDWQDLHGPVDWVICGGESGPYARPINSDWVRSLRDQCAAARVPFHWKQWGEWVDASNPAFGTAQTRDVRLMRLDGWTAVPADSPERQDENAAVQTVVRVGTKAAGRLLDGRTHDEFPT